MIKRNQWKWLAASVGFSIAVLALVLYFTIDETTIEYLGELDPRFLLLALLFHLSALCFWALRIQKMSKSLGYSVGFRHCLNMVFANLLVAAITPSQAGGEPVRIHELYRADVSLGDATAIVIMERVLDGIVLAVIGGGAMLLLAGHWSNLRMDIATPLILSWVLITGFVLVFVYSVRKPEMLKSLLKRISVWFTKRWQAKRIDEFMENIDSEVDNFHNTLALFVGRAKGGLFWGAGFTVLFWTFEFLIASFLLMGLGQEPFFAESFVAQIIIAIVMMIPLTPGSSGIAELTASSIYGIFVPSSIVGVFVVLWRIILYYVNIIIGVLSSIYIVRREIILRAIRKKREARKAK